jgi:hypothetical protein
MSEKKNINNQIIDLVESDDDGDKTITITIGNETIYPDKLIKYPHDHVSSCLFCLFSILIVLFIFVLLSAFVLSRLYLFFFLSSYFSFVLLRF